MGYPRLAGHILLSVYPKCWLLKQIMYIFVSRQAITKFKTSNYTREFEPLATDVSSRLTENITGKE